jgi:hypothetical protein
MISTEDRTLVEWIVTEKRLQVRQLAEALRGYPVMQPVFRLSSDRSTPGTR